MYKWNTEMGEGNTAVTYTLFTISENQGDLILCPSWVTQRHTHFLSEVVSDLGLSSFETDFFYSQLQ